MVSMTSPQKSQYEKMLAHTLADRFNPMEEKGTIKFLIPFLFSCPT